MSELPPIICSINVRFISDRYWMTSDQLPGVMASAPTFSEAAAMIEAQAQQIIRGQREMVDLGIGSVEQLAALKAVFKSA